MRREQVFSKVNIRTSRKSWSNTQKLLQSLTPDELNEAAKQENNYIPIASPAVKELLKLLGQVGMGTSGSADKRSYLLTELKSSLVYWGCPVIYLTINLADRHCPLTLYYSGAKIDIEDFVPEEYDYTYRVNLLLQNPLAVVEYFHGMVKVIIDRVLKGGMLSTTTAQ
jgi:hypothetical protein